MKSPFAVFLCFMASISLFQSACTTAKKKTAGGDELPSLLDSLESLKPVSDETIASLKAISEDPNKGLPPATGPDSVSASPDMPGLATGEDPVDSSESLIVPESWRSPGLNPDEVNPGDIFSENRGTALHKVFSLLDEIPASERSPLLAQFTQSKHERVPVTLSRSEIAELEQSSPDLPLPSRSVALDYRTETHTLETDRHAELLAGISRRESSGAIAAKPRLDRLRQQLASVRKRLHAGETLYLVTAVAESSEIRATYPGAPVGKRDAELVHNALAGLFPHLRSLEAKKENDVIRLTGSPRILWEFDTRELKLEGDSIVIDPAPVARL